MPGTAKICSMTMEPVMSPTISGNSTVTSGMSELRNTCLQTTASQERPLAFASVT